jgi:hypothetical protein
VQISRIRLSPDPSGLRSRPIDAPPWDVVEASCRSTRVRALAEPSASLSHAVRQSAAGGVRGDSAPPDSSRSISSRQATGSALTFVCGEVWTFSAFRAVLVDSSSITGAVGPFLAWIGSGLLPSAGVTRPRRYYEPIRHLRSPALALTGSPLRWRCRSTPRPQTSLVAHRCSAMRAAIFTPVRPSDAFLARLSDDGGLPIPLVGRLSRLIFSRPRRCSLLLRPAWPADPQKGPFPEVLQTIRRLLIRPGCFRLERELPGGVCTHVIGAP